MTRKRRSGKKQEGFTLVELLVVITIIGMLMGLIFPAFGTALDNVRRTQCQGKLREIGIALQAHESTSQTLPPGVTVAGEESDLWKVGGLNAGGFAGKCVGPNWASYLLPKLGEPQLYNQLVQCMAASANTCQQCAREEQFSSVGSNTLNSFICPSADPLYEDSWLDDAGVDLSNLAKGNYAACFGGKYFVNEGDEKNSMRGAFGVYRITPNQRPDKDLIKRNQPSSLARGTTRVEDIGTWKAMPKKGVKRSNAAFSGGMARTILVSEILAYPSSADGRGCWAWAGMGASVFTGHLPPNAYAPDVIPACDEQLVDSAGEPTCRTNRGNGEVFAGARSTHPGQVNVLMADWSATNVADDVQAEVWRAMTTRGRDADEANLEFPGEL